MPSQIKWPGKSPKNQWGPPYFTSPPCKGLCGDSSLLRGGYCAGEKTPGKRNIRRMERIAGPETAWSRGPGKGTHFPDPSEYSSGGNQAGRTA